MLAFFYAVEGGYCIVELSGRVTCTRTGGKYVYLRINIF